jgi:hypothetical protein
MRVTFPNEFRVTGDSRKLQAGHPSITSLPMMPESGPHRVSREDMLQRVKQPSKKNNIPHREFPNIQREDNQKQATNQSEEKTLTETKAKEKNR